MKPELDESLGRSNRGMPVSDSVVRSLLETVPVLTWSTLPDGELCYINQRVVDYTGRSLKELVRLGWADLIHPDDRDVVVGSWSNAVQTGTAYQVRHRLLRADGEYRRFLVQAAPLLDGEGRVIQFFGLSVEIDENTKVAEAMRHARETLASIGIPAQTFSALSRKPEIALGSNAKEFDAMKQPDARLSARERAIVRMMGDGLSNKTIARQLSIAPETVKSHAKSIFWKLTVRSRAEAVYRAVTLGLM
jgi:PAS domain S-box-containing protein